MQRPLLRPSPTRFSREMSAVIYGRRQHWWLWWNVHRRTPLRHSPTHPHRNLTLNPILPHHTWSGCTTVGVAKYSVVRDAISAFPRAPRFPYVPPNSPQSQPSILSWVHFVIFELDQVAVCFTVGIIGNPNYAYNSFGLNWGTAYDLPNTSWVLQNLHGFSTHPVAPAVLRRRSRRALYQRIETIIDK